MNNRMGEGGAGNSKVMNIEQQGENSFNESGRPGTIDAWIKTSSREYQHCEK